MSDGIGIVAAARYLPWFRLTQEEVARTHRRPSPARPVERRLAGYDEDALTMAIAAGRLLPSELLGQVERLTFTTTSPPYLDKNNASAAHAALGLAPSVLAFDAGGAYRSTVGLLTAARHGTLELYAHVATMRPGAVNELKHGDAGAALLLGTPEESIAVFLESSSQTDEVLDQWRLPSDLAGRTSEDRFPQSRLGPAAQRAISGLATKSVDHVIVSAPSARVAAAVSRAAAALGPVRTTPGVGYAGSADLAVQLCHVLATAEPRQRIAVVTVADGCDVFVLECTDALLERRPYLAREPGCGAVPTYLDALAWRGLLHREPPRRPEPSPVSPAVAGRRTTWKFALQGSKCGSCGAVATPPQRICVRCASADTVERVDLSRKAATIRTFSVDRLAFSPNPPMVAAVVDFDGGGRLEVEVADTEPGALAVGRRVQMALRVRHSSGGIHNYAWKAILEGSDHG